MRIQDVIENVVDAFTGREHEQNPYGDAQPASQDPMGDPGDAQNAGGGFFNGQPVAPASQDPYGDPADTFNRQQVRPASQDPMGDPGDSYNGQQVLPASQDPYGDPADQR